MKPDAYMPFYGNDFFSACAGMSEQVICSYLRALWHYWHHTHCSGLPADDDYLRRVCGCPETAWMRTKGLIFGESGFFKLKDGLWHQDRCNAEYQSAAESYASVLERSRMGVEARVRPKVQPEVEPQVKPEVELFVNQSESESLDIDITQKAVGESKPKAFQKPTLEEVKLQASKIGLPVDQAEAFWHFYESKGWLVGKSHMKRWVSALSGWNLRWRSQGGKSNATNQSVSNRSNNAEGASRNAGTYNQGCEQLYADFVKRAQKERMEKRAREVQDAE